MSTFIEGLQQTGLVQNLRWADFLAVVQAKLLSMDYVTDTDTYTVYAQDGLTVYACTLVFTTSSANYPFPLPDGYTQADNDADVGDFTTNFQATANEGTHFAYGTIGSAIPLAADLIGISVGGVMQAVSAANPMPITGTIMAPNPSVGATGSTAPVDATEIGGVDSTGKLQNIGATLTGAAATTTQQALVVALSPNSPLPAGSNALGSVSVTGTVAATQSGTWNIGTVTSITNPVAVTGTFWQTTQPVSGTVTADQGGAPWTITGNGVAGTPDTGVFTIQGISGGTPVPVSGAVTVSGSVAVTQSTSPWITSDLADGAVANGAAGTKSMLGGLIYLASAPTLTGGNQNSLLGDVHGNLLVSVATPLPAGTNGIGSVTVTGTVAATQSGTWNIGTLTSITNPVAVTGTFWQTTQPVSGTVAVSNFPATVAVTQSTSPWITQDVADGSVTGGTAGTFSQLAGGVYNSTPPTLTTGQQASLQLDANGDLKVTLQGSAVSLVPGTLASYSASIKGLTAATTPTDIFTIIGSASKTVTISRITISGQQSGPGVALFRVIRRSAANTGGTSSTVTAVPNDTNNAAATAVVKAYTANPTQGAAVGDVVSWEVSIPGTGQTAFTPFSQTFGAVPGQQGIVLRGVAQTLAINLNGVTMGGSALNITIEWTEQ
jgi:hypothetical protein